MLPESAPTPERFIFARHFKTLFPKDRATPRVFLDAELTMRIDAMVGVASTGEFCQARRGKIIV
jgi:hypothetical protein